MNDTDLTPYEDLLPDDAIPVCGFRLISYMNSEGSVCYKISQTGDAMITQLLGIIEMAKHDITTSAVNAAHKRSDEDDG